MIKVVVMATVCCGKEPLLYWSSVAFRIEDLCQLVAAFESFNWDWRAQDLCSWDLYLLRCMMYCTYLVCYVLYVYTLCAIYAACLVYCMYLVFCNLLYGSHSSSEIVECCSDPFEVFIRNHYCNSNCHKSWIHSPPEVLYWPFWGVDKAICIPCIEVSTNCYYNSYINHR